MFTAACRLCMSLVVFGVQIDAGGLDRCVPQIFLEDPRVRAGIGLMGGCAVVVRQNSCQSGIHIQEGTAGSS